MNVKEFITSLRIPVPIEFRIKNRTYGGCRSDDLLAEDMGDYEIEDWFVFSEKHCVCINLIEKDDQN